MKIKFRVKSLELRVKYILHSSLCTHHSFGFTLVELIIVSGLTVVLGLIFSTSLVEIFKGENKSRTLSQIRQNGQLIMDNLADEIRQSEKVICVGDTQVYTDTIVLYKKGTYTRFRFTKPLPVGSPTSNGYISFDSWESPLDQSQSCDQVQLNPKNLTDRDPNKGVSLDFSGDPSFYGGIEEKIFKVQSQSGFNDIISIKFKAFSSVASGQNFDVTVQEGGVLFNTSVQLRNYK